MKAAPVYGNPLLRGKQRLAGGICPVFNERDRKHPIARVTSAGPCGSYSPFIRYTDAMGGERSSAIRQRLAGKTCALCRASLPAPHIPGEQLCERCAKQRRPRRRVFMTFQEQTGWCCQFLEEDARTPLPRRLNLLSQEKLLEIAERGGAKMDLEARQALRRAIDMGRGGIWLELTEEQYRKLKPRS